MAIGTGAALLGSAGIQAGSALLGSFIDSFDRSAEKQDAINYQRQKEFAQNQLQWRAEDARKAGVSAFAALGGQGSYYTPSYSGSSSNFGSAVAAAGSAAGDAMQKYAYMAQQQALESAYLDNRNKELDLRNKELSLKEKMQKNPTEINQGSQFAQQGRNLRNDLGKENKELLEDSPFSAQFKLQAIKEANEANPARAYRIFEANFPGVVDGVFHNRSYRNFLIPNSVPAFNWSKINSLPMRDKLALAKNMVEAGYYDSYMNTFDVTPSELYNDIKKGRGFPDIFNDNEQDAYTRWH
ncbi:DNA pilot protein [Peromfec virus RodF5_12]|uniref:DNA pilot protein n=1 Tax=Peromfec virus RodF5_12 TaxID=2929336 RepID=A0A976N2G4_9VIRU|nr:DNA pilot protein [Peromfec virus RodF5_12]